MRSTALIFLMVLVMSALPTTDGFAANSALDENYSSRSITTLEGLVQNDVKCLVEDSYGYIWIGTNDGLCRYDGYKFKRFVKGDLGLGSNLILDLAEDKHSNIWVSTIDKGLFCYLRSQSRFVAITDLLDDGVTLSSNMTHRLLLTERADDSSLVDVWCCDSDSHKVCKYEFNIDNERVTEVVYYDDFDQKDVFSSLINVNGDIFCSSRLGRLYRLKAGSDRFERVFEREMKTDVINSLTSCGDRLFVATYKVLISIDINTGETHKSNFSIMPRLVKWQAGKLWVVCVDGTYRLEYDMERNRFGDLHCVESFKKNDPMTIIEDRSGAVWVGFLKMGIRRYDGRSEIFKSHQGFGNDHISYIYDDSKGRVWVGTDGSGLYIEQSQIFDTQREALLAEDKVYAIVESPYDGAVYVATNRKLYRFDDDLHNPTEALADGLIRYMFPVGDMLYMGTYKAGLERYNIRTGEVDTFTVDDGLPSNIVRNLMRDHNGDMILCTSKGLARIPAAELMKSDLTITPVMEEQLGGLYFISIVQQSNGDVWCGTLGDGLFRLRPTGAGEYDVKQYSTKNSLPNDSIKAILEDNNGAIWVSTNHGLARLSFDDADEVSNISSYNTKDGLQDYEFIEISAAKLSSGALLFGGVAGLNSFMPRDLAIDVTEATPAITDFRVNFKSVFSDEELNREIGEDLYSEQGVELPYDQNSISIEFASIHFGNPDKNQYKYMLQGVDREWVSGINGMREVNYSNLTPGLYDFHLRAANSDGVWSNKELILPIVIRHPFWSDWYAIVLYIILLVAAVVYTVYYYKDLLKRRSTLSLMKLEKQKAEETLEIRSRLFTNISHEFRTPLTIINSSIEQLNSKHTQQFKGDADRHLTAISDNGEVLMRLINEVMNFSKIENGYTLEVKREATDVVQCTTRLFLQFESWAERRGIELTMEVAQPSIIVNLDLHLWGQAIYNVVSNAVKHTPKGGRITLRITESEDSAVVEIIDTGAGIEESRRERVFDRFFSVSSVSSQHIGGTGVGLYLTRQIVEMHDGEVSLESSVTPGSSGTTLRVEVPKFDSRATQKTKQPINSVQLTPAVEPETTPASGSIAEIYGTRPTILLVDDSPEILDLLCDIFSEEYNMLRAEDGAVALDMAAKSLPDLIISDIMMPNKDGYELCDSIKSDAKTSHIPVILLSSKSDTEDIAKGLRLTADAYCTKPFNNTVLFELVTTTLINRRRSAISFGASSSLFDPNGERNIETADQIFLKRVNDHIIAHIDNPELKAEDICKQIGVTQFQLNRKLRALSDMTINSYIRKLRLLRAAELLSRGDMSVSEVTYSVGFSDLRYFRDCFKREFGVLPKEMNTSKKS